jgi:glyoxylase-like metal-dependent hydrolase (beta-lactamase superfamily II)
MTADASLVIRVKNQIFSSNTYLCKTSTPGECILIDPGLDREGIEATLKEARLVPRAIFCTHGHFDHLGSAEYFRRSYAIVLYLHGADRKVARSSNFLLMAFKVPARIAVPEDFLPVDDGFTWSSGADELQMVHVPGHTPGSSIVCFRGNAFTGDTLYRDGVGLVSLPGEDEKELVASLHKVWSLFPDDTVVHPGHGGAGPFGELKRENAPLRRMLGLAVPRPA